MEAVTCREAHLCLQTRLGSLCLAAFVFSLCSMPAVPRPGSTLQHANTRRLCTMGDLHLAGPLLPDARHSPCFPALNSQCPPAEMTTNKYYGPLLFLFILTIGSGESTTPEGRSSAVEPDHVVS